MVKFLICIDLDGTTLKNDKTLHEKTLYAIQKVSQLGHLVIISTGRPYYSSYHYYHELGLTTLVCNRNGAHIHLPSDKSLHFTKQLRKETLLHIIEGKFKPHIEHVYIENKNELIVFKGDMEFFKNKNYQFETISHDLNFNDVMMCTLLVNNEVAEELYQELQKYDDIRSDIWRHLGEYPNTMIEIFPKHVNKAEAIETIRQYYKIPHEHTMAIGDEENDIEMLKYVRYGVAVKNAKDEVKKSAQLTLPYTNDEGGVGEFLKQFFNLE